MHVPKKLYDDISGSKTVEFNGTRIGTKKVLSAVGFVMRQCALEEDNAARLSSVLLRARFGTHYNKVFDWANANGYIIKSTKYFEGRCMTYGMPAWSWLDESVYIEDDYSIPLKRTRWVEHGLNSLSIDYDAADEWMSANLDGAVLWHNRTSVDDIKHSRLYYVFDKQGRLHTNYTVLKKYIRRYCSLAGSSIVEVDIKNCQPMLAAFSARKDGVEPDKAYMDDLADGTIYESLMPGVERKRAKKACFVVLFGENDKKKKSMVEYNFARLYPNMYRWMVEKKRLDYTEFSRMLQTLESKMMYGEIVPKLYDESYPILTIHDSVHVPANKVAEAKTVVRDAVAKIIGTRGGNVLTSVSIN